MAAEKPIGKKRVLLLLPSIACGATAACAAVLYSNIPETIKTRLQLDGEGAKRGAPRVYSGVTDAFRKIYQQEGIRGLHSGLGAALVYQAVFNGIRLGCYEPIQRSVRRIFDAGDKGAGSSWHDILIRATSAATSGAIGSAVASPLYLVKNRLQSEFAGARERHGYTSLADGLRKVWRAEGVRGLFRGIDGALPRVMVGSSVQLTSYDVCKLWLERDAGLPTGALQTLLASLMSSVVTVTLMNPFDVVSTRLYQSSGKATSYTGPIDCARQTFRAEGLGAFMKGWTPQYLRLGPHLILTFVVLDEVRPIFLAVDRFVHEVDLA